MKTRDGRRKLAAVMFTDVVGYSAMIRADEIGTLRRLTGHFRALRRLVRAYAGKEIKTIGDGMLISFDSALAAVNCALAIQQDQAARNGDSDPSERFQIRVGIHLGDVEMRGSDLFGDGVNLAARVQSLAPSGGMAVTTAVRAQIHGRMRELLRPIGVQNMKNIAEPIEVFIVDVEAISAAQMIEPVPSRLRKFRNLALLLAGVSALVMLLFLLHRYWSMPTPRPSQSPVLAVLPFENLSDDLGNGYFATGMQEEVLSRLAPLPGLRVISHMSTALVGADRSPSGLSEWVRRLGISHLLEGSVQRSGSAVRIRLRLSETRNGAQIWAEQFDRRVDDVLAVQSEVAAAVVGVLRLNLSATEAQSLGRRPTAVAQAYDDYLRGLALVNRPSPTAEDRTRAAQHFASAVQQDPSFAAAWAWRSRTLSLRYIYGEDSGAEARNAARVAAERARMLQPELFQAKLAEAYYQYWVEQEYPKAYTSFERLRTRYPNDAEPPYALALISRRLGRWQDSLRYFDASLSLDPLNSAALTEWGLTLMGMRRFEAALAMFDRALNLTPHDAQLLGRKASAYLALGRLAEAEACLQGLPLTAWDYVGAAQFTLWQYQRRSAAIIEAQQRFIADLDATADFDRGLYLAFLGWTQHGAGQAAQAQDSFRAARTALTAVVQREPDNYTAWSSLATAEAGLGSLSATEQAGAESLRLLKNAGDAYWTPVMEEFLARAEAGLGRADLAVPRLQRLLQQPYGEWPLTLTDLRLSPDWDLIRRDPQFQALLRSSAD
ncbi:MAG: adenylate/guanylate cyclase domain-containing protein [Nevskiaceae bacterium]|nr:MAG: adenylate/guanylate cyclase domain-containing protein [Nevskiaceae bacterium]TAM25945.1 MAG: adenylate/guanylate cyclase domain-containing protein [Nevskiaceae bacterium]